MHGKQKLSNMQSGLKHKTGSMSSEHMKSHLLQQTKPHPAECTAQRCGYVVLRLYGRPLTRAIRCRRLFSKQKQWLIRLLTELLLTPCLVRAAAALRPMSIFAESLIDVFHAYRSVSDADTTLRRRLTALHNSNLDSTLHDELLAKYFTEQGIFAMGDCGAIFGKVVICVKAYFSAFIPLQLPSPSGSGPLPGKRGAAGQLELVVLNNTRISRLGDICALSQMLQHVTELDLTNNSITDWRHISTLLLLMPRVSLLEERALIMPSITAANVQCVE